MSDGAARSIVILDLYARDDGFVGDAAIGSTGGRLRALGHAVELLRSVRDVDTAGPEAWLARIGREVAARDPDLVVMTRAWDRAVVDAIRAALRPGTWVVRVTGGVAAAADTAFDHVVDEENLFALVRGEPIADGPLWRPTRARELRRLPRVEEPANGTLAPVALDGDRGERRPTISGPASGCPFLLDTRKNPLFERAALDGSRIQTRGCSFCLDNSGAYAMPSETDVVDTWLSQWKRIRAANPEAREVLLTDERPHPFLPAFFDAIAHDPALRGIELMIKSRVDWLLEFADTAMERALVSATASGSVLHVYLVGFESFDAFHLELFNKGVSVADNVSAIEKLRELAARHPRSFEYRKYRAHGIVLFTPWTTPESLLENARWMREVRFDELRTETVHTRLRLYPRTPLHALAAADGLLTEDFGARGDRAIEQGYDASVPWRFRDARVEAIQRLATELARLDRSMPEPYLIELATHFVLRWPGLANVADGAQLVLREADTLLGPFSSQGTRRIGPIAATFDPEIDTLVLGLKRASLKEGVSAAHAERLVSVYRAMGLQASVVSRYGFEVSSGAHDRGSDFATVAVAARPDDLARVLELQRAHAEKSAAPVGGMGVLMGYPACCASAFDAQRDRGDNLENERQTYLRAPHEVVDPSLNRFARVRLVSHHPCSPACAASIAIARAVLDRIAEIEPSSAAWIRNALERAMLVADYDHRIELDGAWDGDVFRVTSAAPLDVRHRFGFDVTTITTIELSATGVEFTLRDGSKRYFAASRPLLLVPGAPLAPAAARAIATPTEPARTTTVALPRLPSAIRVGATARSHRVESVRTERDHHAIVLGRGSDKVQLRVRSAQSTRDATLRTAVWAIDIDRPEALDDDARGAVTVFVRALAAASRG